MQRLLWQAVLLCSICAAAKEPDVIYLTWVDDPTTTMTVVWHGRDASRVMFHPLGESQWMSVEPVSHTVPETTVDVHRAQLQELKSGFTYVFKIEGSEKLYRFRTLPQTLEKNSGKAAEVRFVVGGDMFYYWSPEVFERMNHAVSFDDPDFVVFGGDLAYVFGAKQKLKGRSQEMQRWQEFLHKIQQTLHGKEGRMIPFIPVVGNHDVHKKKTASKGLDIFYEVFPFPEKGKAYRMMQAGNYLSLACLDTGHTWPIDGVQTEWLKDALREVQTSYRFAAYHVGAYPSVYKFKGAVPKLLRETWVPLFEEAQVCAAFEHHGHACKRTYPIRDHKKDPTGVVYLGDGSWGVPTRPVWTPEELWYLEKSASVNACWFVRLTEGKADVEARSETGEVIDHVTFTPRKSFTNTFSAREQIGDHQKQQPLF